MIPQAVFNAKISKYWPSDKNKRFYNPGRKDIEDILEALQTMGNNLIVETRFNRFTSLESVEKKGEYLRLIGDFTDFGMKSCFELVPIDILFTACPDDSRVLAIVNKPAISAFEDLCDYSIESELENSHVELGGYGYDQERFFEAFYEHSGRIPKNALYVIELTKHLAPVLIHPKGSFFEKEPEAKEFYFEGILLKIGLKLLPTYTKYAARKP